eukprot:COSAG02_NODE_3209_length_7165_cov_31.071752_7_plen_241_part_00
MGALQCGGTEGAFGGGGGEAAGWTSAGAAEWMRVALAVAATAVVFAVCGLLAVGSRGEVGGGDGLGVCSGEGDCGGGFEPSVHPTSGEGREASGGASAVQSWAEKVCGRGVGVWVRAAAVESRWRWTTCDRRPTRRMLRSRWRFSDEWRLTPVVFAAVESQLGVKHTIDLFASKATAQTPRYVSRFPDGRCVAVDAFNLRSWAGEVCDGGQQFQNKSTSITLDTNNAWPCLFVFSRRDPH